MSAARAEAKRFLADKVIAQAAADGVKMRQPLFVSYNDWRRLNALELSNGLACGRPRLTFTSVDEMLAAPGRTVPAS